MIDTVVHQPVHAYKEPESHEGITLPIFSISLTNGNSAEFMLAISGSFKGMSDFGETELPATAIRKVLFG